MRMTAGEVVSELMRLRNLMRTLEDALEDGSSGTFELTSDDFRKYIKALELGAATVSYYKERAERMKRDEN